MRAWRRLHRLGTCLFLTARSGGREEQGSPRPSVARRAVALIAIGVASLLVSACGVPVGGAPQALPAGKIPYNLEGGAASAVPSTTQPVGRPATNHAYAIYLLDNNVLVPERRFAADPTPKVALAALAQGPSTVEFGAGVTSSLPLFPTPNLSIEHITRGGVATVALDASTASTDPVSLYEALGQIVYTLTQFCDTIQEVSFTYAGKPFPAFLPNGTAPAAPVVRVDYAEIVAPASGSAAHRLACLGTASS